MVLLVWSCVKTPCLNPVFHEKKKKIKPAKAYHEYKVLCALNALGKYDFIVYFMIAVFKEAM